MKGKQTVGSGGGSGKVGGGQWAGITFMFLEIDTLSCACLLHSTSPIIGSCHV